MTYTQDITASFMGNSAEAWHKVYQISLTWIYMIASVINESPSDENSMKRVSIVQAPTPPGH